MTPPTGKSGEADHNSDDILEWAGRLCWCGIYTRQSRQSNEEYSSCQVQFDACLEFVKARFDDGWVWNGHRYDDEAESSETLGRPGIQTLVDHIRAGKVNRVVVYRLDRISRRLVDCTKLLQEFQDRRIPLTIIIQPELGTSAEHSLLLNMMASFAEFEQEMTRERLVEARAAHKRHGRRIAGVVPYGYAADPITRQLVVVPKEAGRVRKMFEMAAGGQTPAEIAAIANRHRWRTRQRTSRKGRMTGARPWSGRQVLAVLSNPVYAGLIHAGDQLRPGVPDPIVEEELFDQVQQAIASRRTSSGLQRSAPAGWPLRGILRCGQCGRPMSPSISGYRNFRYRYYRCRSDSGGRPPCRGVSVPAQEMEQFVVETLGREDFSKSLVGTDEIATGTVRAFMGLWPRLPDRAQLAALPQVVREIVFNPQDSTITVTNRI